MRSSEIAEIAGVTVRTLRHYHQIGILPEPPRLSNGYREYTADHLVILLRIAHLADSGLSLAQAGVLASSPSDATDDLLDEVDRSLEEQIAVLTRRRELLAQARARDHVGLSKAAAALSLSSTDVPSAVLFAHLYRNKSQLDAFAEALQEPHRRSILSRVQKSFDSLDDASTDEELENLAAVFRSIIPDFDDEVPGLTKRETRLILDFIERDLNDRQKEFLRSQL